ncbi:hypothetical protein V8G54_012172 [Vigna mungo]|uniref:Uncharacterized protein n=1 Tax=Vigna mungo TaxID=3915 RepID=A0AAQ3NQU2_VIGMU
MKEALSMPQWTSLSPRDLGASRTIPCTLEKPKIPRISVPLVEVETSNSELQESPQEPPRFSPLSHWQMHQTMKPMPQVLHSPLCTSCSSHSPHPISSFSAPIQDSRIGPNALPSSSLASEAQQPQLG